MNNKELHIAIKPTFKITTLFALIIIILGNYLIAGPENNPPRCNPCIPGPAKEELIPATVLLNGTVTTLNALPGEEISITITDDGIRERLDSVVRCKQCSTILSSTFIRYTEEENSRLYNWSFSSGNILKEETGLNATFNYPNNNLSGNLLFKLYPLFNSHIYLVPPTNNLDYFSFEINIHIDSDNDGLLDAWEIINFGNLNATPDEDLDQDGLTNIEEFTHNTHPLKSDTDGDTLPDGFEIAFNFDPTKVDSDDDGINDADEIIPLIYSSNSNGTISGEKWQILSQSGASGTAVTAVPDIEHHFVNWSDGVTTATRIDTNVTKKIQVTASFALNTPHTVTFNIGTNGSKTGGGSLVQTVNYGENPESPEITPNSGWQFLAWNASYTNITKDLTITALYVPVAIPDFIIAYLHTANGSISGINPQAVPDGASGTMVTALPNTGYHFTSWSDGSTTISRREINVTSHLNFTASFALNTYTLTYNANEDGYISGPLKRSINSGSLQRSINHGGNASVTAVPNAGSHFVNWSDGVTTATRTDANVASNISVTANFAINTYRVTFNTDVGGSFSGSSIQIVDEGHSTLPVTALPEDDYLFYHWSGDYIGKDNPLTISNILNDQTITAVFIPKNGDYDNDELTNGYEYSKGLDPFKYTYVYYVDNSKLDDSGNGLTLETAKKTINAALNLAKDGYNNDSKKEHLVLVSPGTYTGTGNTVLDLSGYPIKLFGLHDATNTIIDCEGLYRAFIINNLSENNNTTLQISDFTIKNTFAKDIKKNSGGSAIAIKDADGYKVYNNNSYSKVPSIIVSNCVFQNSVGDHGAVINAQNSFVSFKNCSFANNTNRVNGRNGGVCFLLDSSAYIDNCTFTSNYSLGHGGAIYSTISPRKTKQQFLKITNSTFGAYHENTTNTNISKNNKSRLNGGAIYLKKINLIIDNCKFLSNTHNLKGKNGGAIYILDSPCSVNNSIFKNNCSTKFGGSIYIQNTNAKYIKNVQILNSIFEHNYNLTNNKDGGAIYANKSQITIDNATFIDNESTGHGGAIFGNYLELNINDSSFVNNKCTFGTKHGGALYVKGKSSINIVDSYFHNNESTGSAGAIYFNTTSKDSLYINRSTFSNNKALKQVGGSIRCYDFMNIENSTFNNNYSYKHGGAIYTNKMNLTNSTISGNTTSEELKTYGGGIYTLGEVNIYNSTIWGNSAKTQGGGLYRKRGDLNIYSTILSGNYAASYQDLKSARTKNFL